MVMVVEATTNTSSAPDDAAPTVYSPSTYSPSTKEIRAWCRQEYGSSWWEVEASVKQDRKREAKAALSLGGGGGGGGGVPRGDDVASPSSSSSSLLSSESGSARPTQKEIRAWCRQEYGASWWDVAPKVKAARKKQGVEALSDEAQ